VVGETSGSCAEKGHLPIGILASSQSVGR
jgi:hypothetical protein